MGLTSKIGKDGGCTVVVSDEFVLENGEFVLREQTTCNCTDELNLPTFDEESCKRALKNIVSSEENFMRALEKHQPPDFNNFFRDTLPPWIQPHRLFF